MRKILILMALVLILIGINSDYYVNLCQKYSFSPTRQQKQSTDLSDVNTSQYFFESSDFHPVAYEKPSFSLRLHSGFRLLILTISFKEICIKQFFKNKFLTSEIISNICLVKRLHAGYYTYGLGKIRF